MNQTSPHYQLRLPGTWIAGNELANAMRVVGDPHHPVVEAIEVTFGHNCRLLTMPALNFSRSSINWLEVDVN
jgi:hypothetical protein